MLYLLKHRLAIGLLTAAVLIIDRRLNWLVALLIGVIAYFTLAIFNSTYEARSGYRRSAK